MRIYVKSDGKNKINIFFPTRLIFNFITASIYAKHLKLSAGIKISAHDLRKFMREFRRIKKRHPHLQFVDIESADGDIVKIKL